MGRPYAALSDCQGNIQGLINPRTSTFLEQYIFSAFGETSSQNYENPWRYASKRFDADIGLVNFGQRLYDPSLGRWLTTDPAGFIDTMNLYAYARNNPFLYRDPDGRFAICIPFLAGTFDLMAMGAAVIALPAIPVIVTAVAVGTIAYVGWEAGQWISHKLDEQRYLKDEASEAPPYDGRDLGNDPAKCPGEGWEWRGDCEPGGKEGAWFNSSKGESLHADLDHPPPKKPHWDYKNRSTDESARCNTDGTWEWKTRGNLINII